ncbi:hypothetical protein ACOKS4_14935 [Janibacter sp. G349]|uniref:hypothetical protein n=1 Tax=Janibacter sp. G349 TaxID=3405424 RepID=UPI003B7FCA02
MSEFCTKVETEKSPEETWRRLWDLDRHTAVIPLTTVTPHPPATRLGAGVGFTGRTALGSLGFDDVMRVVEWSPPSDPASGRAVVDKVGRVVGGRIEVTVASLRHGSRVTWRQTVRLPWLPRPLRWIEALAARVMAPGYRRAIRTLLA